VGSDGLPLAFTLKRRLLTAERERGPPSASSKVLRRYQEHASESQPFARNTIIPARHPDHHNRSGRSHRFAGERAMRGHLSENWLQCFSALRRPNQSSSLRTFRTRIAALPRKRLQMNPGIPLRQRIMTSDPIRVPFRSEPRFRTSRLAFPDFISSKTTRFAFQSAQEPSCWSANLNCYMGVRTEIDLGE